MPIYEDKSFKDYVNELPAAADVSSTDIVSKDKTSGDIVKVDGDTVSEKGDVDPFNVLGKTIVIKCHSGWNYVNVMTLEGNTYNVSSSEDVSVATSNDEKARPDTRIVNIQGVTGDDNKFSPSENGAYFHVYTSVACEVSLTVLSVNQRINCIEKKVIVLKSFATSLNKSGITDDGEYFFNTASRKVVKVINMAKTEVQTISPSKDSIYVMGGEFYFYDGFTLSRADDGKRVQKPSGKNFVGHLDVPEIEDYDINHIIFYGQSLSMGTQSANAITTESVANCYMLGESVWDRSSQTLSPLKATVWPGRAAEDAIVSATNSFAALYHKFVNKNAKFLASSCGVGGYTIAQLSKQGRFSNIHWEESDDGYYVKLPFTNNFDRVLVNARTMANDAGVKIGCPAIVYMQGEADYGTSTPDEYGKSTFKSGGKDAYKERLLNLKNDMQASVMQRYSQSQKPLFFIYQTCGKYVYDISLYIAQAQKEFSEENDDVILLPPTYFTPDFAGGHLTTNGYRWYGEQVAKYMWYALVNKCVREPVKPTQFVKKTNEIEIYFSANKMPLVFDKEIVKSVENNGFNLFKDRKKVAITGINIVDNKVIITTDDDLDDGVISISYGGIQKSVPETARGEGTLRDSSNDWVSMYDYWDDGQEEGTYGGAPRYMLPQLVGKKYPMWDWASLFYHEF